MNFHMSEERIAVIDSWYSQRLRAAFQIGPRPRYWYPMVNTALYVLGMEAVEMSVTVDVIVPLTIIPPVVSATHVGAVVCKRQ